MARFIFPDPVPLFPTLPQGYSMHMKPTFSTNVQTMVLGNEDRWARQAFPLWDFTLTFEGLRDTTQNSVPDPYYSGFTQLQQMCGLFLVCNGQYGRFNYLCPEDNSRVGQYIGSGDGAQLQFTINRTWGFGSYAFTEPVGSVATSPTPVVYLNGSPLSMGGNWSITDNILTFVSAPGAGVAITMDFTFYYFCRFLEDLQDFEQFLHHIWELKSLKFRSVKNPAL